MKPSLQVRLSQHLALTPQLQQSIRLLQLSTLELHQEVEQMLEQNPFLEAEEEAAPALRAARRAAEPGRARRRARGRARRRARRRQPRRRRAGAIDGAAEFGTTERDDWENGTERDDFDGIRETPGKTAHQQRRRRDRRQRPRHRARQACRTTCATSSRGMRLSPADAAAVLVLIDSLDDDGYLADPLEEIAARLAEGGLLPEVGIDDEEAPSRCSRTCAARCAGCRAWSRPASARATWPSA